MTVTRIVPNIGAADPAAARALYAGVLGTEAAMRLGWTATFAKGASAPPRVSIASIRASGRPVRDIPVEVDDRDGVPGRARAVGIAVDHGPADEPWGVRLFIVRGPFGRLVKILCHA